MVGPRVAAPGKAAASCLPFWTASTSCFGCLQAQAWRCLAGLPAVWAAWQPFEQTGQLAGAESLIESLVSWICSRHRKLETCWGLGVAPCSFRQHPPIGSLFWHAVHSTPTGEQKVQPMSLGRDAE